MISHEILSLILLFVDQHFFSHFSKCPKIPLTDHKFQSAISQYITMWKSKIYIAYQEDLHHFNYKLNFAQMAFDPNVTEDWFEDNWKITQFKSLQELTNAKNVNTETLKAIIKDHKEWFGLIARASMEQLGIITSPEKETFIRSYTGRK